MPHNRQNIEDLRDEAEAAILLLWQHASDRVRRKIDAAIKQYGSPAAVPDSVWQSLRQEVETPTAAAIGLLLVGTYQETERGLDAEVSPLEPLTAAATPVATTMGERLADKWIGNLRTKLGALGVPVQPDEIGAAPGLPSEAEIDAAIEKALDGTAVKGIVSDGVTTAITSAQVSAGNDFVGRAAMAGQVVTIVRYWELHPELSRSGPCRICRPLSEMPESFWGLEYPEGPPIHNYCCCALRTAVIVEGGE